MKSIAELIDLSIEEKNELARFEDEINRIALAPEPVISETEISKIETALTGIIKEIVDRGRQQTNKSNA